MLICENGKFREMTTKEVENFYNDDESVATIETTPANALTEMAQAMSTATSLAQMRAAAKKFLDDTSEG